MKVCPACAARFRSSEWQCPSCGNTPAMLGGFYAMAPEFALEGEGFRPEYFAQLAVLEAGNFWFQSRNRLISDAVKRHVSSVANYLEIGCGTGFVLSTMSKIYPSANLTGTEIFSTGLVYARQRAPAAELLQMDARNIPFEDHFDLAGAYDVLEHIRDDSAVLAQIYSALKPDGCLVVTVPQHPRLWSRQDDLACHVRRYTALDLTRKVADAGFRVLEQRSFMSLLLPIMWLARRSKREPETTIDPLAELKLHPALNRLFGDIMRLERLLCQWGIRFPAGGSLLLIARKE